MAKVAIKLARFVSVGGSRYGSAPWSSRPVTSSAPLRLRPSRFGRVQRRCHSDYDGYYVTVGIGMTHIDNARDLRLAEHAAAHVRANLGDESESENYAIRQVILP
jgi:hypothetical protein